MFLKKNISRANKAKDKMVTIGEARENLEMISCNYDWCRISDKKILASGKLGISLHA